MNSEFNGNKKPIHKKLGFWIAMFFIAFLIVGLYFLGEYSDKIDEGLDEQQSSYSSSETKHENVISTTPSKPSESLEELMKEYEALDYFIGKYNKVATVPIKNIEKHNIFTAGYYRSEYQLDSFRNALAYKGTVGEATIEIVNKVINDGDDIKYGKGLRVYAFVETTEEASDILKAFLKSTYIDITDEEINGLFERKEIKEKESFLIDREETIWKKGIVGGWTYQNESIAHKGGYKVEIVAAPDKFGE